uniref:Uncharacterized protein n=1 Tax=Arundo donax TaxID=35708 RepID=A0A0A9CZB9_ARUDO
MLSVRLGSFWRHRIILERETIARTYQAFSLTARSLKIEE